MPHTHIENPYDFEHWLEGISDELHRHRMAITLSIRAVMRVLPIMNFLPLEKEENKNLIILPTYRAIATTQLATTTTNRDIDIESAANAASQATYAAYPRDTTRVALAATRAALAIIHTPLASNHAAYAVHHAAFAARRTETQAIIWQSLETDIHFLENNNIAKLLDTPLWPQGTPDWAADLWQSMKSRLLARKSEHWEVWTNWYDARLDPSRPIPCYSPYIPELERQRVLLPEHLWEQGPAAVNAAIKELIENHECSKKGKPPPPPPPPPPLPEAAADTHFIPDVPDATMDHLARANLAFLMAGQINRIWDEQRKANHDENRPNPGFIIHLDAPWGGGKTTFAAMVAKILSPEKDEKGQWLKNLPLDDEKMWPPHFRRPWRVIWYNAWQHEHVRPPWWSFYETIISQLKDQSWRQKPRYHSTDECYDPDPFPYFRRWWRIWWGDKWGRIKLRDAVWPLLVFLVLLILMGWGLGHIFDPGNPKDIRMWLLAIGASLAITATIWGLPWSLRRLLQPEKPENLDVWHFGTSDPYNKMRQHFRHMMRKVCDPMLVIVDDLDRCQPEHVVDLLRGMQTILNSERVIFLLLGDRDWIEKAFASTHSEMKDLDVGPEHEFGGRFVEKTIQFSLILPEIGEKQRQQYVRCILGLQETKEEKATEMLPEELQEELQEVLEVDDFARREKEAVRLIEKAQLPKEQKEALARQISEQLTRKAVADETVEREVGHMLEGLAPLLPANPRQIKRIINALAIYQHVVRLHDPARYPGSDDWRKLARWIVLMIEWPRSWATLSRHPELAGKLSLKKPYLGEQKVAETVVRLVTGAGLPKEWRRKITEEDISCWLVPALPPTSGKPWEID